MRPPPSLTLTAAAFAVAVIFGFRASSMQAAETTGQRHVVEIRNLKFHPERVTVAPGDTVVWINQDIVPHTVTADDKSWDSRKIAKQARWELVIQPGMRKSYFCRFHPSMKGQLEIVRK